MSHAVQGLRSTAILQQATLSELHVPPRAAAFATSLQGRAQGPVPKRIKAGASAAILPQPIFKMPQTLDNFPPLVIGGAVLNTQYTDNPLELPVADILKTAFSNGMNAIDTSPYYGESEKYLGQALLEIKDQWPRDKYYLCTKAGRIELDKFDYSRDHVRRSVERSLQRLHTLYLDVVYMHDIEFVEEDDIYNALRELVQLKKEGLVHNIGITGYPPEFLLQVAETCAGRLASEIGPLDAVLLYCHGCLQNTRMFALEDRFYAAGIRRLLNGSILSMSLLRSGLTHDFHPGPQELKDCVDGIALRLKADGVELAELATKYALVKTLYPNGPGTPKKNQLVVLGVSTVEELELALAAYRDVKEHGAGDDAKLFERVQSELGDHYNESWASGIHGKATK